MSKKITVLIVEDHPMIVDGYNNALNYLSTTQNEFEFQIHEANNCTNAYEKVLELKNELDLIFLDINLPSSSKYNFTSGESLGKKIREILPNIKIIVATSHNENLRLNSILKNVNPEGFLIKDDFNISVFVNAIKGVLNSKAYYSDKVLELLRKKQSISFSIDDIDTKILREISCGATVKELMKEMPLSKSGIEKRKRKLKIAFNVACESDRTLVLAAREKGFI